MWCVAELDEEYIRKMEDVLAVWLLRQRGEKLERWNQHYDRGGMRRLHLLARENILRQLVVHSGAANLGLLLRKLFGKGTHAASKGISRTVFGCGLLLPRFNGHSLVHLKLRISAGSSADRSKQINPSVITTSSPRAAKSLTV